MPLISHVQDCSLLPKYLFLLVLLSREVPLTMLNLAIPKDHIGLYAGWPCNSPSFVYSALLSMFSCQLITGAFGAQHPCSHVLSGSHRLCGSLNIATAAEG